jgi:mannose-6-phosphate isomerase-like protein (cupin superfamily)
MTLHVADAATAAAPDGSLVRVLLGLAGGGMARFELGAGRASLAVRHRTVEEIWYVVAGRGEMWRSQDGLAEVVSIGPGTCLTIPLGTAFQFRSLGGDSLSVVAVTMPPWPGDDEAVLVDGYAGWGSPSA